MDQVEVHYVGGPADGVREHVQAGPGGVPASWMAVKATSDFGHDRAPGRVSDVHRYERRPSPDAGGWQYHHGGPFA